MTTFSDFSIFSQQIFLRNIGIIDNYPMIRFETKEQLVEFVNGLEKTYYSIDESMKIYPHFVINNPQLFPSELDNYKRVYNYPLNEHNISILYSLKDKFYGKEQQFIEWLEKNLSFKKDLE